MLYLPTSYDPWGVLTSVVIAALASYVALDLASRVHRPERLAALLWGAGGSLVMGVGIWSMHFIGMLAFSLPIRLGYSYGLTLASLCAAVLTSAVALGVASQGRLDIARLVAGALVMGMGICAMHYAGMAALDMSPAIVWDMTWVLASATIAVVASGVALWLFFWLRSFDDLRRRPYQIGAAAVMGLAISGMHYTGMQAAAFPEGTLCLSADALGGSGLALAVGVVCAVLLAATLVLAALDSRVQRDNASLGAAQARLRSVESDNDALHRRVFSDALTGLPNRLLFEDRLQHALQRHDRAAERGGGRKPEMIGVLFIDLDGFKPVNDTYGHAAGDAVLKEAGERLQRLARSSDTVARMGGDEFLMLVEDAGSVVDCMALAGRVVQALDAPFVAAGRTVRVAGSVGVAVYPEHGQRDKLVANADAAMYAAKRNGGNGCALFESHMDLNAGEQMSLLADLRQAVARGQLVLHYQPKVDGHRRLVHGVEALLRWQHPLRGMVEPDRFIALAERFGLINQLGAWVIEEACRQMAAWAREGLHMRVAINLSVHQLRESDLVQRIAQALQRHAVPAAQLLCEITESVAMEDVQETQRVFDDLARIGVFLAIDDFGVGYCSLSYLRQLPAHQLKIDRSFVQDLEQSQDARAVVDAVIRLAHALGLRVVAEGVETAGQSQILVQMGCDELQGYHFARPMPAEALLGWARSQEAAPAPLLFSASVLGAL
ncbi:putative signaling protein [Pseudorhodoferax aquiterrae]|uniref:Signaling protein n=1 Tax=Pseudorhodoferax aquiterrae TaxID=747304 RepID=A0ABQ3G778_9BURK|nr:bifunctional diguanylate cyclase/phosphodiesterase [Pseudorhodoferax aquiterrae]GHC90719.1 putative signaling protein [Pseudorhodoferax aquiterrae]